MSNVDGEWLTIAEAWQYVVELAGATGDLKPSSLVTYRKIWRDFERYSRVAFGVELLRLVDDQVIERFVAAPAVPGRPVALSTSRNRLVALKYLFSELRKLPGIDERPAVDLSLSAGHRRVYRPLTPDEIVACRHASITTTVATRQPALLALAEAGASTSEIGFIRPCDLECGRVWAWGAPKTRPRWLNLSKWGRQQVERRVLDEQLSAEQALVFRGDGSVNSRRSSVTAVLTSILQRAGLADDNLVGPRSLSITSARAVLETAGRIEEAARHLGFTSLDSTAAILGWDWSGAAAS